MKKPEETDVAYLRTLVGQQIDAYNDGKASPSRLVRVVVDDVVTREHMSRHAKSLWKKALEADFRSVFEGCCYYANGDDMTKQFWDWNCDAFVCGHILYDDRTVKDPMLFARRPDGFGWYCVNWNYSLDIEGRVRKANLRIWRKCAAECGQTMKWHAEEGRFAYFDKATGRRIET